VNSGLWLRSWARAVVNSVRAIYICRTAHTRSGIAVMTGCSTDEPSHWVARNACARGTTRRPRFVTGDQWKNAPRGLRSADNEC